MSLEDTPEASTAPVADPPGLLEVRGLEVCFASDQGPVARALRGVDLSLARGRALALIGESGSGKSSLGLALMRLLPPSAQLEGSVSVLGVDCLEASAASLRQLRGGVMAMVFQHPQTALNPVMKVRKQVAEAASARGLPRRAAVARAEGLLEEVGLRGLPRPCYPHQLSGGMQQRVMIAQALAGEPALLIADEPTTALDVVTEAAILELLHALRERYRMGLLLITHDPALARGCDEVAVLYGGEIVEGGPAGAVLGAPAHPYTAALLAAMPRGSALPQGLPGRAPDARGLREGCGFASRCSIAGPRCHRRPPELLGRDHARVLRCHLPPEERR